LVAPELLVKQWFDRYRATVGAPQQSLLIQRIQVSPHGNDRDAQLFAQSFYRNPSGLLQTGENSGKADLLFILGRAFKLWLSIRADSWPWGPFTLHIMPFL
jgi:hypothetical protein